MLVPLRNFATINANRHIYRSAQPTFDYEYRFIKNALKVDTIVNIRSESNIDKKFAPRYNMRSITFPVPDHHAPTLKQANRFMQLIKSNCGILFHCEHGHGRTSTFCVLARLSMGWSLDKALKEEKEVFGYEFKHPAQILFLRKNFTNNLNKLSCSQYL